MQLVLNTRYTKEKMGSSWIYQFYKARYLRLFPIYLGGSLIVICAVLLRPSMDPLPVWIYLYTIPNSLGNLLFKVFFCLTNLTMFFQELTMFFSTYNDQIYWSGYLNSEVPLWRGLLIPQAWTLGIELSFYLIAPYLLNLRTRWLIAGLIFGLAAKLIIVVALDLHEPWTYRFFPFELGYFLLGAVTFRYRRFLEIPVPRKVAIYCVYPLAIAFAAFSFPIHRVTLLYPLILAFMLPFMFQVTSNIRIDRLIGELSYPFYIFHYLSLAVATIVIDRWVPNSKDSIAWVGLAITFFLSVIGLILELQFLEPWRIRITMNISKVASLDSSYKPV
jgi:peptidoglycan/LPS O-acetylase OafA/YrhL